MGFYFSVCVRVCFFNFVFVFLRVFLIGISPPPQKGGIILYQKYM